MSPIIKNDPEVVPLSQSTLQNMDQISQSRHTQMTQGISNMASRMIQEDDLSSQDNFSLCSSSHQSHGTPTDLKSWALSDVDALESAASSKPDSPEVQMLSSFLSQQLMPSTVGPSDVMYHTGSELPGFHDLGDHDLDFSSTQDFNQYSSSLVDFSALDNDVCGQNGNQSCKPEDVLSAASHGSHADEAWHTMNYPGSTMSQFPTSDMYQPVPVSPPLTEAGNDISVTSSCSHSGYPTYMSHEDAMLRDVTVTPIGSHEFNPADPLFPLTPPLSEQDPNRTIRPSKSARRPTLQSHASQSQGGKQESELFPPLPVKEPLRQRSKESADMRNPRDHPYYSMSAHSDGKYYCPFANGDKPCNHPPTTQKCAYHKYLDSHLKPYRCKVAACMDAALQFSSNACLFRHEREAHGLHGHGDNPHLCLFDGCDRSVPGYGFPRRWNLFDHMRRVHDYTSSERLSSPDASPSSGQIPKKTKETPGRKRRVPGVSTGAQTMKRTRSTQSQTNPLKAIQQSSAHHGQRLDNAEKTYYNCRSRLLEEINHITPQDTSMHEKVNASLQELITLGLNYRHIEASQLPNGMPV